MPGVFADSCPVSALLRLLKIALYTVEDKSILHHRMVNKLVLYSNHWFHAYFKQNNYKGIEDSPAGMPVCTKHFASSTKMQQKV